MRDLLVDIEGKEDLMYVASLHFESLDHMLSTIDMDQSTYYSHLNDRADFMDLDHAQNLTEAVLSWPRFRLEDPDDYIKVPESEGWGSGRLKLDDQFRQFIFGRRLFDPVDEDLIESISGFSRADISNYRNEDRWIPEEGYRNLFNYFKRELQNTPDVSIDMYPRRGEEPVVENLSLKQFSQYWLNRDEVFENKTKEQVFLEEARDTREKFDDFLGDYLEEWEREAENQELRERIIDQKLQGDREISPETADEEARMYELTHKGILHHLYGEKYWLDI